jgi:hypothetical protein
MNTVLNKIDLVPPEIAVEWVNYLRREHPCVPFKSSTQKGRGHIGMFTPFVFNFDVAFTPSVFDFTCVCSSHFCLTSTSPRRKGEDTSVCSRLLFLLFVVDLFFVKFFFFLLQLLAR